MEVWFNGHLDAIGLCWLVAGLVCLNRGAGIATGLCWGLALATRVHMLPILLLYALWRRQWLPALISLLGAGALYAAHRLTGSDGGLGMTSTFATTWLANALVYQYLEVWLDLLGSRTLVLAGVAGLTFWLWCRRQQTSDVWEPCDLVLALALVCGPVLNPWYLLWILPFAVHFRQPFVIAVLMVGTAGYGVYANLGVDHAYPFTIPPLLQAAQWIVLGLGIVLSVRNSASRRVGAAH
jgi:hypothetical protein